MAETILLGLIERGKAYLASTIAGKCGCWACAEERNETPMIFVVCAKCGNKRCPHCSDHRFKCTGSNEPGQKGEIGE